MLDFLKFRTADGEISQSFTVEDESSGSAEVFSLEHLQARAAELAATHQMPRGENADSTFWRGAKLIRRR